MHVGDAGANTGRFAKNHASVYEGRDDISYPVK